jgi:hypothetical protein
VESITRLGGFRALKKTTEAPYTTKVNYCKCTSRGTTLLRKPLAGRPEVAIRKADAVFPAFARAGQRHDTLKRVAQQVSFVISSRGETRPRHVS